ncbi:MAG: DUF2723 domain-containing protein, partial [Gemmatimonadaceae bacterium]|nr:DUF2723 domain-containing protein [Gemmatimonadaceae bacterium]
MTLWDSGEFLAAIKTLGIPHPAGTPFYILVAECWSFLFAPVLGFARAINLFSAVATAGACALLASLVSRWMHSAAAGICAGVLAGVMSTVWMSATETEVYALAMLLGVVILYASDRCGTSDDSRWALLAAYLIGLACALHLSVLVALPAAAVLLFSERGGSFRIPRGRRFGDGRSADHSMASLAMYAVPLFLLGASCILFMLVRARHDPAINQGNPSTWSALWDVVTRKQYGARAIFPRSAPFYVQLGNVIQYADWQLALGLSDAPGPSFWRTSVTLVYAILGVFGSVKHRAADRRSWRAILVLLLSATIGVVVYLNLKAGPSFGHGIVNEWDHEARERDYFFFFAFVSWAVWAGIGAQQLGKRLPRWLAGLPFVVAALPIVLNWGASDRRLRAEDSGEREAALAIITPLPRNAVMFAVGDNDTYPLWYLQQVEGIRRDVTVVTIPLLSAAWYRAELARRS